jgi:hypothetical protein
MRAIRSAVCLGWLLTGCMMQGEGPVKKLTDTVQDMNKATRWGQLVEAERLVEPVYRTRFLHSHAHWGQTIQVADSEVVHMEMAPDQETAVAAVSYEWYLLSAMTLHTTVVQQRWAQVNETFLLVSESVVQGDARLLAANAKEPEPGSDSSFDATSGDEVSVAPM